MRTLELERVWTGDGRGTQFAVTQTQVKRTDTVALYKITLKNGAPGGYEVFMVKIVEGGTPLPGGGDVEESYEQYPTANRFGRTAWHIGSLEYAEKVYGNLVAGRKSSDCDTDAEGEDATEVSTEPRVAGQRGRTKGPRPQLTVPVMEFSVKELAELNKVEYTVASIFVKESVESKTIKFVRPERRASRGKETNIYAKV
jgi:hypothetical protein